MEDQDNLLPSHLATWRTGNRITVFLIENLPDELWEEKVPGYARKTVRMIGGHLHNCRCMWVKSSGEKFGLEAPENVDRYGVSRKELIKALGGSSKSIEELIAAGYKSGGNIPGFALDAVHFLNYMMSHEAHHRGQIIMVARQLEYDIPDETAYGLWQWSKRAKEV